MLHEKIIDPAIIMNIEEVSLFEDKETEKYIELKIFGTTYQVPSEFSLLKSFQYITEIYKDYQIDLTKHCWSGICKNCLCKFQDEQLGKAKGLACLMDTCKPIELIQIPRTMKKLEQKTNK